MQRNPGNLVDHGHLVELLQDFAALLRIDNIGCGFQKRINIRITEGRAVEAPMTGFFVAGVRQLEIGAPHVKGAVKPTDQIKIQLAFGHFREKDGFGVDIQFGFDTDLCRAILQGYLAAANGFLDQNDYAYIYDAIRLIAFELGLRFFSDYLAGNVYFKAKHEEHNLVRALVQFQLTASIEAQQTAIRALIDDLANV